MGAEALKQPLLKLVQAGDSAPSLAGRALAVVNNAGSETGQMLARHCAGRQFDLLLLSEAPVDELAEACRAIGAHVEVAQLETTDQPDHFNLATVKQRTGSASFLSGSLRDSLRQRGSLG
jgi:hypothetical protein